MRAKAAIQRLFTDQMSVGRSSWRQGLDILGPCKRKNPRLEGLLRQNAVGCHPADLAEFPFSTPYEKRIERSMFVLKRFSNSRLSTLLHL
ncbi:hypothetical protein PspCFBP13509_06905 [Pseudomonas sp. CFBP13509]|nr:hypothetical protein PspCFBP13509_06905 [Pseudomonas sp. CFBP13509]